MKYILDGTKEDLTVQCLYCEGCRDVTEHKQTSKMHGYNWKATQQYACQVNPEHSRSANIGNEILKDSLVRFQAEARLRRKS